MNFYTVFENENNKLIYKYFNSENEARIEFLSHLEEKRINYGQNIFLKINEFYFRTKVNGKDCNF